MIYPTIHLNGTSKKQLLEEYSDACAALHKAIFKMERLTVHDRDYYPQGPEIGERARKEMRERIKAVLAIRLSLMAIMSHIDQQEGR
jgi:hypothetical protein